MTLERDFLLETCCLGLQKRKRAGIVCLLGNNGLLVSVSSSQRKLLSMSLR